MDVVVPSLVIDQNLQANVEDIVATGITWCHVTIMDGQAMDNFPHVMSELKRLGLKIDIHLIVAEPAPFIAMCRYSDVDQITVHCELGEIAMRAVRTIKDTGCFAGIACKPETPIDALIPFLPYVSNVLVMTVQQQPFQEILPKLKRLARLRTKCITNYRVAIHGYINEVMARACREHGADVLVVEHSLFFNLRDKKGYIENAAAKRPRKEVSRDPAHLCTRLAVSPETRNVIRHLERTSGMSDVTRNVLSKHRYVPLSDDWFTLRGKLLTASDMAAVLGENKYCSPNVLFKRKTRQGSGFSGNAATRWGQKYEDEAAAVYSHLTSQVLVPEPIGLLVHDYEKAGCKRYAATPDFMTMNGIMVEIKCPFRREITSEIPRHYTAQVIDKVSMPTQEVLVTARCPKASPWQFCPCHRPTICTPCRLNQFFIVHHSTHLTSRFFSIRYQTFDFDLEPFDLFASLVR